MHGRLAGGYYSRALYENLYIYNRALSDEELRYLYLDKPELMVNNYLYNQSSEYNGTAQWYDMHFREYDPVLGRMNAVDPLADKFGPMPPYNYAFNNPVLFNDPLGDESESSKKRKPNKNKVMDYGTYGGMTWGNIFTTTDRTML